MFEKLEVFRMAHALAVHSSARQAEIAGNVANADTPGYRATDIAPFSQFYSTSRVEGPMHGTRAGHVFAPLADHADAHRIEVGGGADPNGNTVALEAEMVKSVEVMHAHETALSVYESARNILRTSLGSRR